MAGGTPNNSGRVTTQQFYQALLDNKDELKALEDRQNDARSDMEHRIMDELKGVPTQVDTNKDEIDRLRKRSNYWDAGNTVGLLVAGVMSAIGWNK